jgi:hypothetical protein
VGHRQADRRKREGWASDSRQRSERPRGRLHCAQRAGVHTAMPPASLQLVLHASGLP